MLVAIIAALMLTFIVLVDPKERAELLDEDGTSSGSSSSSSGSGSQAELEKAKAVVNLLTVSPGRLDYLAQNEIDHPLPSINIFTKTESEVLAEKNSIFAKRSHFSQEADNFKFDVDNVDQTDNLLLAFEVLSVKGRVLIRLNGETVFNGELEPGNPAPITLSKNFLKRSNDLVFEASSPGMAFWATNVLSFQNLKVVADVTDLAVQSSSHSFLVSETEKNNLEKVVLLFQPDCQYDDVGKLRVTVNDHELYYAVPDCELAFVPIEFSPDIVQSGENSIVFQTERGTFILSHVVIQSQLEKVEYPTYYFDISLEQFEAVKKGDRRVRVKLDFVDVSSSKFGEIILNGYQSHFDTKEVELALDLSKDLVQGTNSLKVKPRKTLEIRELRADLVKG